MRAIHVQNQDFKVFEVLDKNLCKGITISISIDRAIELIALNQALFEKVQFRHPDTFIILGSN